MDYDFPYGLNRGKDNMQGVKVASIIALKASKNKSKYLTQY